MSAPSPSPTAAGRPTSAAGARDAAAPKRWALFADPDRRRADTYRGLAAELGLEPVVVRSGDAALMALRGFGPPTLLVTELSLPLVDGFAVLREVRRVAPAGTAPAIVVSPFLELRDAAWAMQAELGIAQLLSPSSPVSALRAAMVRALGKSDTTLTVPERARAVVAPSAVAQPKRDERARLARIAAMGAVDDGPPDAAIQKLVEETAAAFGVPVALATIVLEDRQWFAAHTGLGGRLLEQRGGTRDESFCRHVVEASTPQPFVVPDAATHPFFAGNPLVREGFVRSYAGAPVITTAGDVLGTLCIIDSKPLAIDAEQVDALAAVARRVAGELELRAQLRRQTDEAARLRAQLVEERARRQGVKLERVLLAAFGGLDLGVLVLDSARRVLLVNPHFCELLDVTEEQLAELSYADVASALIERTASPDATRQALRVGPEGPFAVVAELELVRPVARKVRWTARPMRAEGGVGHLCTLAEVAADGGASGGVTVDVL